MTGFAGDTWYDEEAGPLVRLYAITGGRTEAPPEDFTIGAIVQQVPGARPAEELPTEQSSILRLAREPMSVSEIAARIGLPLGAVRILLGDLRRAGLIAAPRSRDSGATPSMQLLERVRSGLLAL
jgi:predicted Rossmann fold nucleotide-binding protein DprA/Smf involved in DNA uptake